jgi:hypothetical protein
MRGLFLDLPEVIEAMNILFGAENAAPILSKALLNPVFIKSAYRRRAFETHPDRAAQTGEPVQVLEGQFRELSSAYETVMHYVNHGGRLAWTLPDAAWPARKGSRTFGGIYTDLSRSVLYTGEVPQRRLLLGQYLYFSRVISRSALGAALVWQKMGRPLIGQIAMRWKWLVRDDIRAILSTRIPREKFCGAAERLGYLAPYQTITLLGRQRVLQPRLGQYFIEKGLFDAAGMARAVRELRRHNRKYDR